MLAESFEPEEQERSEETSSSGDAVEEAEPVEESTDEAEDTEHVLSQEESETDRAGSSTPPISTSDLFQFPMSKTSNNKEGFASGYVMVNRQVNSRHPMFKGDGIILAIYIELVTRMAYEPTTDNLGKTKNKVPLMKHQTLTSFRTLQKALGFPKHLIEPRIQKLVDGIPAYGDQAKVEGVIRKMPCEKMKGADGKKLSRNDGMVITIKSGAKFWRPPDTKPDDVNTNTNTNTSTSSRPKKFKPPTCDEVLAYAIEKEWPNAKSLADRFFEYYDGTGWIKEKVGKPVLNWKLTMCDWQHRQDDEPSIKAVKRTGRSSYTPAGPEALIASDTAALGMRAA
jgi:hypothetical protein